MQTHAVRPYTPIILSSAVPAHQHFQALASVEWQYGSDARGAHVETCPMAFVFSIHSLQLKTNAGKPA